MDQPIAIAFGKVLRVLRKQAKLSQEQLAFKASLQRGYISIMELGEKQPTITSIFKLSAALDIRPADLIALVEEELQSDASGVLP